LKGLKTGCGSAICLKDHHTVKNNTARTRKRESGSNFWEGPALGGLLNGNRQTGFPVKMDQQGGGGFNYTEEKLEQLWKWEKMMKGTFITGTIPEGKTRGKRTGGKQFGC